MLIRTMLSLAVLGTLFFGVAADMTGNPEGRPVYAADR
jgi:hypothetical protein